MGSERGKSVMSMELAMRREMAYRRHLELVQLIEHCKSGKLPASLNQTSLTTSKPTSEISLNHISNPKPKNVSKHPCLDSKKRPDQFSVPRPGQSSRSKTRPFFSSQQASPRPNTPQNPGSTPRASPSNVGSSASPMSVSTIDPSHKRKEACTQQFEATTKGKARKLYCDDCKVQCPSSFHLQMHFGGHKHQAQVKKDKKVESDSDDTRLYCKLCEVWCMNQFSWKQHVVGKNHMKNFMLLETTNEVAKFMQNRDF